MFTSDNYLIPQESNAHPDAASSLHKLLQKIINSHHLAISKAHILLSAPPIRHPRFDDLFKNKALTMAHAKFYTTGSGFGVAYCSFMSLSNVCREVLSVCQEQLLPCARIMDKHGSVNPSFLSLAIDKFRTSVTHLKEACCTVNPNADNLMLSVQALMPSLAKLSGQIDNDVQGKKATLSEVPAIEALPHLAMLSHIKNFSVHVNQVLRTAQSILNVMSDWQDRLNLMLEQLTDLAQTNSYEDQIHAAIMYWQSIQITLTQYLQNHHDKPESNFSTNPVRTTKAWRPRLETSESWA